MMQFQVIDIEFDFDDEDDLDDDYISDLIDEVECQIWTADDEEDLIEEITSATGWCIKSINYRHVLK